MNDAKGRVFHDVAIDGLRFKGQVLPTGDIAIIKFRRLGSLWIDEGFVSIGAASIRRCSPLKNAERSQWWICKYNSDEPRLNLQGMTEEGRNALAYEFGLPVIPNVLSSNGPADPHLPWSTFVHGKEQALFYFSPAFAKSLSGRSITLASLNPQVLIAITYAIGWRKLRNMLGNSSAVWTNVVLTLSTVRLAYKIEP